MYMDKDAFVAGNMGRAYVDIQNRRINLFNLINFESTADIESQDLPVLGRSKVYRPGDVDKKFKMSMYDCSDEFIELVIDYMETGYMPPISLQVVNDDPKSSVGRRTLIYEGVLLDSIVLQTLDVTKPALEREVGGTYDRVRHPEKFKSPRGMR